MGKRFVNDRNGRVSEAVKIEGIEGEFFRSEEARPERKVIALPKDEKDLFEECLDLIAIPKDEVFVRDGKLVGILEIPSKDGKADYVIRELTESEIRIRILDRVQLRAERPKAGKGPGVLPRTIPQMIQAAPYRSKAISPITGIRDRPFITKKLEIVQEEGLDSETGNFLIPSFHINIPKDPTKEEAEYAFRAVEDVFKEFPFVSAFDRSAYFALLFSLVLRDGIKGRIPGFGITANQSGAGKTLLASLAYAISEGRFPPVRKLSSSEDLQHAAISAAIVKNQPLLLFDNITETIKGASIEAAITSDVWGFRQYHSNTEERFADNRTIFCFTGRNLQYGADTVRRVIPIRLVSSSDRPEMLKHEIEDLKAYVIQHRAAILKNCFTVVRAFLRDDAKAPRAKMGGFEGFAELVVDLFHWMGRSDPLYIWNQRMEDNEEEAGLRALWAAWPRTTGESGIPEPRLLTAGQLITVAMRSGEGDSHLADAIKLLLPESARLDSSRLLGKVLAYWKGHIFRPDKEEPGEDWTFRSFSGRSNQTLWKPVRFDPKSFGG